jgi:hypothetical protein
MFTELIYFLNMDREENATDHAMEAGGLHDGGHRNSSHRDGVPGGHHLLLC